MQSKLEWTDIGRRWSKRVDTGFVNEHSRSDLANRSRAAIEALSERIAGRHQMQSRAIA